MLPVDNRYECIAGFLKMADLKYPNTRGINETLDHTLKLRRLARILKVQVITERRRLVLGIAFVKLALLIINLV
jgi:hypothetical protein